MAPLTQRPQVVGAVVFGSMIEVRNRQNDAAAVPDGVVLYAAKLAFVVCAFQNRGSYLFPIRGVPPAIFRFYRHYSPLPYSQIRRTLSPYLAAFLRRAALPPPLAR